MNVFGLRAKLGYVRRELRWYWVKNVAAERWRRRARDYRWIFILGCNNSGTTLLTDLLSRHPEISRIPREGQHQTLVLSRPWLAGVSRLWTERLDVFRLTEADRHIDSLRLMYDWLSLLRFPSRPFVLEKSPPDTIRSRWLQHVFPNASFIGLVRNGYAVAEGIRRRESYTLERCARHWNSANKLMLEDSAYLQHFVLVRYEDLTENPMYAVRQIGEFLRIDSGHLQNAIEAEWKVHNLDNAPARIQDFNAKSLARLSASDMEVITAHAGEMLELLGYSMRKAS